MASWTLGSLHFSKCSSEILSEHLTSAKYIKIHTMINSPEGCAWHFSQTLRRAEESQPKVCKWSPSSLWPVPAALAATRHCPCKLGCRQYIRRQLHYLLTIGIWLCWSGIEKGWGTAAGRSVWNLYRLTATQAASGSSSTWQNTAGLHWSSPFSAPPSPFPQACSYWRRSKRHLHAER